MNTKHKDDLYMHIRDAIRLQAADMTQRIRPSHYIADGQAVYSHSDDLAREVTERLLKTYRISRSPRSERVVKQ